MTAAGLDFMAARYLDAVRQLDTAVARAERAEQQVARVRALCDEPASWDGYDTRGISRAFLAESVLDLMDEIRAATDIARPLDADGRPPTE